MVLKTWLRSFFVFGVLGLSACGSGERVVQSDTGAIVIERSGAADMVLTDNSADEMAAAIQRAKDTFAHYLDRQKQEGLRYDSFAVNVALPTKDGGFENIWVRNIKPAGSRYSGTLANHPYNLRGDKSIGDRVQFSKSSVVDWTYSDMGRMRGHFTTRLLIQRMPKEKAEAIRRTLHPEPMPST